MIIFFDIILLFSMNLFSQIQEVYFYNVPHGNINIMGRTLETKSYLEIISQTQIESHFNVSLLNKEKHIIYSEKYTYPEQSIIYEANEKYYYFIPLKFRGYPSYIDIESDKFEKEFKCSYKKVTVISSSNEYRCNNIYFGIVPNSFKDPNIFFNLKENKDILLPSKVYNSFFILGDTYGKYTLENWIFNLNLIENLDVNLRMGNLEIYNAHAWKNNGGGRSLFVSFRPMSLTNQEKEILINGKTLKEIDFNLNLSESNLLFQINDTKLNIISIQEYYEINQETETAIKSYIIQLEDISKSGDILKISIKVDKGFGESLIQL